MIDSTMSYDVLRLVRRMNAEVLRSLLFSYDMQQVKDMDVLDRRSFVRMTNCVGCVRYYCVDRKQTNFLVPQL